MCSPYQGLWVVITGALSSLGGLLKIRFLCWHCTPASGSAVVCLKPRCFLAPRWIFALGVRDDLGKEEDALVAAHVTVSQFWPCWKISFKDGQDVFYLVARAHWNSQNSVLGILSVGLGSMCLPSSTLLKNIPLVFVFLKLFFNLYFLLWESSWLLNLWDIRKH